MHLSGGLEGVQIKLNGEHRLSHRERDAHRLIPFGGGIEGVFAFWQIQREASVGARARGCLNRAENLHFRRERSTRYRIVKAQRNRYRLRPSRAP